MKMGFLVIAFLACSLFVSCTKDRLFSPPVVMVPNDSMVQDSGGLFLNEIMASSGGSYPDPIDGASDDWFEIYNSGKSPVNLSGWALSDDPSNLQMCILPDNAGELTIAAGGYMVFWADDTPTQGSRHLAFKLSSTNGDKLYMSNPKGDLVDSVSFGPQTQEVSLGRVPDATGFWKILMSPSPGSKNQ